MSTPRFLTDEDFRNRIIRAVQRLEPAIEIRRAVDVGLQGLSDEAVLDHATANNLLLISHDESTLKPIAEERVRLGQRMSGLFLVPQDSPPQSVALIWAASQAEEWKNLIFYLPLR